MAALMSAGSNAGGQLSHNSTDDSHQFRKCSFHGYPSGMLPYRTHRVRHIAAGSNHTVALLELVNEQGDSRSELWGCGDGSAGQLGVAYAQMIQSGESPTVFRLVDLELGTKGLQRFRPKLVCSSWETTYIALECDGEADVLVSMGADYFGDLGVGGVDDSDMQKAPEPFHIVDLNHALPDGCSDKLVIKSLNAGQHHVVAHVETTLLSSGNKKVYLLGWGASRHGQLGDTFSQLHSGRHPAYSSIPVSITTEDLETSVLSVGLGSQHTVFVHPSRRVRYFGSNRKGQLQGLEKADNVRELACTWNGTYLLVQKDDGTQRIVTCGSHLHGQLGRHFSDARNSSVSSLAPVDLTLMSNSAEISGLACGSEHVLVLASDEANNTSEIWGWGWNEHGNLGIGHTEDVFLPQKVWPVEKGDSNQKAAGVWAGCGTSWIYVEC